MSLSKRNLVLGGLPAGLVIIIANLLGQFALIMGMMSAAPYAMVELMQLAAFFIASWLGARVYENALAARLPPREDQPGARR